MTQDLLEDVRRIVAQSIDQRTVLNVGSVARQLAAQHTHVPLALMELLIAKAAAGAYVPMKLGQPSLAQAEWPPRGVLPVAGSERDAPRA